MFVLASSAVLVGLIHALVPGHWLPVVLVAKTRKWDLKRALFGALVAASGHVLVSISIGLIAVLIGWKLLPEFEEEIERYSSLILIFFGLGYSFFFYRRHSACCGHTHHGPEPKEDKSPFWFLFLLGFSPCIAVTPVIVAAATKGGMSVVLAMIGFSIGVLIALFSATALGVFGLMKLDHPLLEHHGDALTGLSIALMGVVLFFFPI